MTRDLLFGQPPDKTDLMVAGEEIDGMSCMCGCHVMDDPANAGMRCDFCGCGGLLKVTSTRNSCLYPY